ncbi:hypothetical protein [Pseudooceanicola sp. MF1-13]|uniref:hypothetical protein n=1 Tax=Pseudooceanicola sp. MF1-13 TaxID=3379095 RepID=UPI003891AF34
MPKSTKTVALDDADLREAVALWAAQRGDTITTDDVTVGVKTERVDGRPRAVIDVRYDEEIG